MERWRSHMDQYFAKHVATYDSPTAMTFREPGTGIGFMRYLIDIPTRSLIVLGDYDDAIYQFRGADNFGFDWFREHTELDYFARKCTDDEAFCWDPRVARKVFEENQEWLLQWMYEDQREEIDWFSMESVIESIKNLSHTEPDEYTLREMFSGCKSISLRTRLHHDGLRRALTGGTANG